MQPSRSNENTLNQRNDLMNAIKTGGQLKSSASVKHVQQEPEEEEDLAAAIRAALDSRKGAFMESGMINIYILIFR